MLFYCRYFDGNFSEYYYEFGFDDLSVYSTAEYSKSNYYDIVLDYLNNDLKSLACFDYMCIKESDNSDPLLNMYIFQEEREAYKRALELIENDINAMPNDYVRKLIEHVLIDCDDDISKIDNLIRYSAFIDSFDRSDKLNFTVNASFCASIINHKSKLKYKASTLYDSEKAFREICEQQINNTYNISPMTLYQFTKISDMILFFVVEMIRLNCKVKKCANCGRFFVPRNRSDEIYCRNISPQDNKKTCQEYGKYMTYLDKSHKSESTKLYKQIYNSKANRAKRANDDSLKKDLEIFRERVKQWRIDIAKGVSSEEEFINWLKAVKAGESNYG